MTKSVVGQPMTRLYSDYIEIATAPLLSSIADSAMMEGVEKMVGSILLDDAVPPPAGIEIPMEHPMPGFDISLGFASGFGNKTAIRTAAKSSSNDLARSFSDVAETEKANPNLWKQLDNFWFEFDLRDQQSAAASVYFSAIPPKHEAPKTSGSDPDERCELNPAQIDAACAGFDRLIPTLTDDDRATLKSAMQNYHSTRPYLLCGAMLSRRPNEARLVFAFTSISEVAEHLRRLGLGSYEDLLLSIEESYGDLVERVLLGIAPLVSGSNKIGLELYAPNGWMRPDGRDRRLITRMLENGHCHPANAQAILDFPGLEVVATGREHWPISLHRDGFAKANVQYPVCVRRFHHVKLTLERGGIAQTKAYLSSHFQWCRM